MKSDSEISCMRRGLRQTISRCLRYAGLTPEEYRQIKPELHTSNRQNLRIFSLISAFFLFIMFCISFVSDDVSANRWVYFGVLLLMAGEYAAAQWIAPVRPGVLMPAVYLFISVLFVFGIVLGTVAGPDEQSVTFIALVLTMPLLFIDTPLRMGLCIYLYVLAFIVTVCVVKVDYVLAVDIINAVVFGLISVIVSTYMMGMKCRMYLYEQRAVQMSETDLLTGLRNRNAYENHLSRYPSLCRETLTCVFVDINGLHEWNNTHGHQAGDEMIRFVGAQVQVQFGRAHTYRTGGDEFVAFAADLDSEQLHQKLDQIERAVEARGYHISIGCDTDARSALEMSTLIWNAEQHMYAAKRRYYQTLGGRDARSYRGN